MRVCLGLFLASFLCFLPTAAFAEEVTVAVMPVEDLSLGGNGYSQAMTADINALFRDRGMKVVAEAAVMEFMVRNRIRRLGYLDSQQLAKAKEQLGAEVVVLASVNQRREENPPVLGLTLQLVRTADGRVLWAGGGELCRADVRRLLGLTEPKTIEEVQRLVVRQVMANLPSNFSARSKSGPLLAVDSAKLSAKVLRPGETVACRIKFSGQQPPKREDVVVLVGNKEIPVSFREREHYYEAFWPAGEGAGEVAVTLKVGGAGREEEEIFVGTYQVDNQAPKVILQAIGLQFEGRVVFRESVSLIPVLAEPEPVNRWHLEVVDGEGRIIMSGDGDGLPDRFMWQGQTNQGGVAADGHYKVILSVWDRAGNMYATSLDVELLRRPPAVDVAFQRLSEGLAIDLGYTDRMPLAYWRAQFFNASGELLHEESGEKLPVRLLVAMEQLSGTKVKMVLQAQDILGNQVKKILGDIGGQALKEAEAAEPAEPVPAAGWVEDF